MKKIKRIGMALMLTALAVSANAQKTGKTPEDSVKCIENLSLYQESYKMKNYADAYGRGISRSAFFKGISN